MQAAELLHKNSIYSSVPHCAYYSCLQLIKHSLLIKLNVTESLILQSGDEKDSSHEKIINEILTKSKLSQSDLRTFRDTITQLKKLRNKTDYENCAIIDFKTSDQAISNSKTVIKLLKNNNLI